MFGENAVIVRGSGEAIERGAAATATYEA
jgi:hypothetical protein